MDHKGDLAPPIVTSMITMSFLSAKITTSSRMWSQGGYAETLMKAFEKPLPVSPSKDCTAQLIHPLNLRLPPSPLGNRTERNPKIRLHFVRHAQAQHNLRHLAPHEACNIYNPSLTDYGIAQCTQVREKFPHMDKITHILTSPLQRTLETTLHSFDPILKAGHRAIAYDGLREYGGGNCNAGHKLEDLEKLLNDSPVDLSLITKGWETFEKVMFISARDQYIDNLKKELYSLCYTILRGGKWKGLKFPPFAGGGNIEVLFVSHGTTLRQLTGSSYHNAQYRTFKFAGEKAMSEGLKKRDLVETSTSRARKYIKLLDVNPLSRIKPPSINVQGRIPSSTADVKGKGKAINK